MSRLVLRNPLMIRRWRHHHDDVCRVLTPTTRIMTTNRRIHIASSVNNNNNRRLSLNLYRQLLRWCDGMDEMAPLSHHIPPLYLQAPNLINMDSLRELRTAREGVINRGESLQPSSSAVSPQSLLTPNIVIVDKGDESASSSSSSSLTVPIATVKDARNLFRAIFRMNARTTDPTFVKEQVSLAFDGIRTLNEMTKGFNHMRSLRESHMDRDGVKYRVGQVVQLLDGTHIGNRVGMKRNNNMQPRGVIVGWTNKKVDGTSDPQKWQNPIVSTTTTNDDDTDKQPSSSTTTASTSSSSSSSSNKTSLTEKSYQSTVPYDHVRYEVMLDGGDYMQLYGDSVTMRSGRMDGTNTEVYQSDLKLVEDPDLFRIRGPLGMGNNRFERFDPVSNSFVLGPSMAYLYPLDSLKAWESWQNPADPAGRDIIRGIQDMATILRGTILDHRQSVPSDKKLDVLDLYLERLTKLSKGDVLSPEERLTMVGGDSGRTQRLMKSHLQTLMDISLEIGVHLWKRRTSNESQRKVQFSLGEVVQHKKYGFRGVVVAWDPHPAYEVTHWDGLQHIDKPDQYPFYHVIPDPFDSVAVFGGERPWRYVCEANLECCPEGRRGIDVDLEPEWTYDSTRGEFLPPDLIKFRHGCDLEDYGVTQRCLEEIRVRTATAIRTLKTNSCCSSVLSLTHVDAHPVYSQTSRVFSNLKLELDRSSVHRCP